ncbi:response regulator [Algivirga pacifica]|uniref:Response regulator n=1 Tax=Algivirga pacifica TaxID=1162670 RepID=A0ABP9D6B9_9BACT
METVKSVFIIDDDTTNNLICKKMIEKSGFSTNVTCITDVAQALSRLQELESSSDFPEVIFLDINMPPSNGWVFLDQYMEHFSHKTIKVFMLSSGVTDYEREKSKKYELVSTIMDKPLSIDKLQYIKEQFM